MHPHFRAVEEDQSRARIYLNRLLTIRNANSSIMIVDVPERGASCSLLFALRRGADKSGSLLDGNAGISER